MIADFVRRKSCIWIFGNNKDTIEKKMIVRYGEQIILNEEREMIKKFKS